MMGFFDKVKKVFGPKDDVESQNNTEKVDKIESMGSIDNNFDEKNEMQLQNSQEPINNEINDKLTITNETRNFRYLDDLIHSYAKVIVLDSDIVLDYGEDYKYKDGIELMGNIVIDGNGHTIDAQGLTRIFHCSGNITIKNITLKNGFSKDNGGAIFKNWGELTIISSTFTENTAKRSAGAIFNDSGELTILCSTFTENTAKRSAGAIDNMWGELTIASSTFTENTAKYGGGVIDNHGKLTITDSSLFGNIASEGGAIRNTGELKITDSSLSKNTARVSGGAIHNKGELTITESIFQENIANKHGIDIFNDGQVFSKENISKIIQIYNNVGKSYHLKPLKNNQKDFTHLINELINTETNEIKLEYDIILNIVNNEQKSFKNGIKIDKDNLVIDGNGHTIDAQGLTRIFHCTGKNITIKNITLKNGYAKDSGGAILKEGGELTIIESTLIENNADNGGAIYNNRGELTITESTLLGNIAQRRSGGAIYNNWGELTIIESTLTGNMAQDGGAIYSNNKIYMNNCTLINNLQSSFSFVENNNKYDIEWNDDFISSDDVTIYLDNKCDGEYHTTDNLIEWNRMLSNGPHEIILDLNDNNKIIMNFTYSSNIVTTNVNNYVELINSIDKAKYIITPKYIINLNKGDYDATNTIIWNPFSNLNLVINGNGIILNGQNSCQFIKIGTNARLILNNIILTNYTEDYGGAIDNMGELTITDSTLTGNSAISGGAIDNMAELTIIESTLIENTAKEDGGAIHNTGRLTISESTLSKNNSDKGGAIHNTGRLTISESTLSENTAKEDGGSIYNQRTGFIDASNVEFDLNTANLSGGAIYTVIDDDLNLKDCTFKDKSDDVFSRQLH